MKRKQNVSQFQLFSLDMSQYLPKNHWSLILEEIFEHIDFSGFQWKEGVSVTNQEPYESELLVKLWIAGYFKRVVSCRKLSELCEDDIGFIYFRRDASSPKKTTLNDFRKKNLEELSNVLSQTVLLSGELGLLNGEVFIDGTKVKANASKKKELDKNLLSKRLLEVKKKCYEYLESMIEEDDNEMKCKVETKYRSADERKKVIDEKLSLLKELGRNRVNTTDPESRLMKDGNQYYDGYNAQAATDNQIVIHADITSDPGDFNQLEPMVNGCRYRKGYELKSATADSGYENGKQLESLIEDGIDVVVAPQREGKKIKETKYYAIRDFEYNEKKDSFVCPNGKELEYYTDRIEKNGNRTEKIRRVYRALRNDCDRCSLKKKCLPGSKVRREIRIRSDFRIIRQNTYKSRSEEGIRRLKRRMCDVEAVFGQIKGHYGLLRLLFRGLVNVKYEWKMICMGHNMRKLVAHIQEYKNVSVYHLILILYFSFLRNLRTKYLV